MAQMGPMGLMGLMGMSLKTEEGRQFAGLSNCDLNDRFLRRKMRTRRLFRGGRR
jgi:hypothetical protein